MKSIRAAALLASPALFACGGGSISVPENYRPPANPVASPTALPPAVQQQRPPPPPAPEAVLAAQAPPAPQPPAGTSGEGFDQLGTESPREGEGPQPAPGASPEGQPETPGGGPQRLR